MNIQIFNDPHVDVSQPPLITVRADADVVVVAGETAEGFHTRSALRRMPEKVPIVMVMGGYPGENPNFNPALVVEVGS